MADHTYCVKCSRSFREDSSHEMRGCPNKVTSVVMKEEKKAAIKREIDLLNTRLEKLHKRLDDV